jgi:hypothetical protein
MIRLEMAKKNDASRAAATLGKLGGAARAKKLTADERSAIARMGAEARAKSLTPEKRRKIALMGVRAKKKGKADA